MQPLESSPLDERMARLERALATSPADSTEIAWLEVHRGQESNSKSRRDTFEQREETVLIRVRESGRTGFHRTGATAPADLENAIRHAMAQARLALPDPPQLAELVELQAAQKPSPAPLAANVEMAGLQDSELVHLTPQRARELVQKSTERGEVARLNWVQGRLAVVNHLGLRRSVEGTAASFDIQCSRNPGAGRAAAAARSLAGLAVAEVVEQARRRQAPRSTGVEGPPTEPVPLVLAPEAAVRLIDLLNRHALSASSFHDETSPLRGNIGQTVFHPTVTVRDDGLDPRGLAFPCDFLGTPKGPVDLIAGGVFLTPAVDPLLAAQTGLPVTPHQLGPGEAQATNLFLMPGELPEEELLRAADGGIWVSALDPVECFSLAGLRFRAVARGARRIRGGALDRALPDLVWEDSVLDVLNRVLAIGNEPRPVATGDLFLGATAAPALAVERVHGLRPSFD